MTGVADFRIINDEVDEAALSGSIEGAADAYQSPIIRKLTLSVTVTTYSPALNQPVM